MGGVKKFAIKWRIFAHDDGAKIFQCAIFCWLLAKPARRFPGKNNTPDIGSHGTATLPKNMSGFTGCNRVTAALGFSHHCESGFLVNLERLQGVGNKQNIHGSFQDELQRCIAFMGVVVLNCHRQNTRDHTPKRRAYAANNHAA